MNQHDAMAETEIRITWHQWHDGRWEAWVTDESGRPPHLVRDRDELERFLAQAYQKHDRPAEDERDRGPP